MTEETTPAVDKMEKESKWYVLRVVSGKERRSRNTLTRILSAMVGIR